MLTCNVHSLNSGGLAGSLIWNENSLELPIN